MATKSLIRIGGVVFALFLLFSLGCTDEVDSNEQCRQGEEWNPIQARCVSSSGGDGDGSSGDGSSGDLDNDGDGDSNQEPCDGLCTAEETCYQNDCYPRCNNDEECDRPQDSCVANACIDLCEGVTCGADQECLHGTCFVPCQGLECDQVACPQGVEPTSVTGFVTIPNGTLPLPNVTVYVPNGPLEPITQGASCERCDVMVSGNPLVQTTTDINGYFRLDNVPVGQDIPLVIQTGKWRRQVTLPAVEECTENAITDTELTRLPRNQSEGDIPRIAVTTGGWDALECLLYKIGIDDQEFTTANNPGGRVTLFAGPYGTTRFADGFNGGATFTQADPWWNTLANIAAFDILMHSCTFSGAQQSAKAALQHFADMGGRAFMTDLHREWLENGTNAFQSVATWRSQSYSAQLTARIDTSHPSSSMMHLWMDALGELDGNSQFPIYAIYNNIASVNTTVAERWVYSLSGSTQRPHYFSFNTPVGADEANQCGRVVYSDLHVAAGGGATPGQPFPTSCGQGQLSEQEIALIYMFFDLSACIAPECTPITCDDVKGCGTHPDGCGSSINCGDCCVDFDEVCNTDADCCDSLWCDDDTNRCTDRCRVVGERCTQNSQCCAGVCSASGGQEGSCVAG